MMVAIDHLRELARQCRRVRLMCPCSPAYERAKMELQLAETKAFAYLNSLEMEQPPAPPPYCANHGDADAAKGGGI